MQLRPFEPDTDFDAIKGWITDERAHAMWCGNRFAWPPDRENFSRTLSEIRSRTGDRPFLMTDDSGRAAGFFCWSLNPETHEGMLKFVVVDPALRGKGTGKAMLRLALEYAFGTAKADAVRLCVFPQNTPALKCYESVGFTESRTDPGAFSFGDERWDRCHMEIRADGKT